ncbi:hypothetical protein MIND_00731300 [Mycena indigotica]|uniref:Acetyl-CoA synthetase-like protein n=1 Tax=Mycena indigotica TaxID=2126181 RepID=A0A8H6SMB2_9AGAR|nr:uncharacterized protein MIND_00731300 [Mycena indigotica]KAF7301658.1 hypothetical protein MIND_00731300 [Mycena indigotica]
MAVAWEPKRTLAETDALLCAPGQMHELETVLVNGQRTGLTILVADLTSVSVQRVYKNQWPSARMFWLWSTNLYGDRTYIAYENQRYTFVQDLSADVPAHEIICRFKETLARSLIAAAVYREVYGVKKGDRIAICARNLPEYLVAYWGCHLIGAVAVLVNAWLPVTPLLYCLTHADCKLILLDPERADRLVSVRDKLGAAHVLVFEPGKRHWKGMQIWESTLNSFKGNHMQILEQDPNILPEDDAMIFFTSGTTGLPKGVLSTQRQFLTNTLNTVVSRRRAVLRRGEEIKARSPTDPQEGFLIAAPFFHATGMTSLTMTATLAGAKIVLIRKWDTKQATKLIKEEKVTMAGGVPSMSSDLIESELAGYSGLDALTFGGAATPPALLIRAKAAFPSVVLNQAYGLTECNSIAISFAAEDWLARPTSCGLASPINDVVIVKDGKVVPRGELGEIWIKGCNVMKGYWRDPAATEKTVTKDGWLLSGDVGMQDEEGFVYIRDRIKDIIIRGGENIDSTSVENALFTEGVLEVAAIGIPDSRLGELVAAVVTTKPDHGLTEESLIALARSRLPHFAVPVMVLFVPEIEHNAAGKIMKGGARKFAAEEWARRLKTKAKL